MFSNDEAKIRIAELKAKGHRSTIAKVARLAHDALNDRDVGHWAQALMQIRTTTRLALDLPAIPKGKDGAK